MSKKNQALNHQQQFSADLKSSLAWIEASESGDLEKPCTIIAPGE
jgi:hypothetical protein